jgi:hypothetical protein
MKKSLVAIAALFALGLAGTANADEVSGTLEAMDIGSRTIVLDDGNAYTVSESVAIESLEPGTEVTVSYEERGGQKIATEVIPAN